MPRNGQEMPGNGQEMKNEIHKMIRNDTNIANIIKQ